MDFLTQLRARVAEKITQRQALQADLDAVLAAPAAEARDLNDTEAARFGELRTALVALDDEIASTSDRVAQLEAEKRQRDAQAAQLAELNIEPRALDPQLKGGRSERTYTPDAQKRGVSILTDIYNAQFNGDSDAQQRLARHRQEERVERGGEIEHRAAGTGAFAGLVVPQYLVDLVAPAVAAMRPLANVMTRRPLPASGMSLNISRITTATSAAVQSSENSNVSETDIDDTLLTVDVQTIGGRQTLSRQAVERGTGTEDIVVQDLVRRYHSALDSRIINQATVGLDAIAGVTATYTDASPTAAEAYPKLFELISGVQSATFMGISHFVMHPRRWNWFASQVGTSFPFLQIAGAAPQVGGLVNGTGVYDTSVNGSRVAGVIAGVPVILDANITTNNGAGTNEDRIYGVTAMEAHLWEDDAAPLYIRAEQPAAQSLGIQYVVYGYFAYTFGRYPSAHGRLSGTGLITPTFA